jgi:hypothetical protein
LNSLAEFDTPTDDSDVPLAVVVRGALGVQVATTSRVLEAKDHTDDDIEGFTASNDNEDIWAFNQNGEKWIDVGGLDCDDTEDSGNDLDVTGDGETA